MILHNLEGRGKSGYTTWGCIWEKGQCSNNTVYELYDSKKRRVPMQSRITAWWPDGSVKWTAHTADATKMSDTVEVIPLIKNSEVSCPDKYHDNCSVMEGNDCLRLQAGDLSIEIPTVPSSRLFNYMKVKGSTVLEKARTVLILEEPLLINRKLAKMQKEYISHIKKADLIEKGPLQIVVRYEGCHVDEDGDEKFPFTIFMKIGVGSYQVNFIHTFFYDGDEEKDYLKGLGIQVEIPMKGPLYNRHVKFQGDYGCFHEPVAELLGGKGLPWSVYESQINGEKLTFTEGELSEATKMVKEIPIWSEFELCQDSVSHFSIRKKIRDENCCYLNSVDGQRTDGGAAIGSENGSILFSLRDFWEKYPSGYSFYDLEQNKAKATIWLWSLNAGAMDFRHYANRGYNRYYYEGYEWKGATPYGIGCTSEFSVTFMENMIPADKDVTEFSDLIKNPPQYVGEPGYYYSKKAFGRWSLVSEETEMEVWLEKQLEQAVQFYKAEVSQRKWYGMFDYGDFMHTYDKYRHQWRYDMGGFAWDNTELVPTMWLWMMFLRTGKEDIFTLAEKLTRHTSEVDVYHMGQYKGLGSRHNVRHWGCPCKEVRISMAGHHRYYYYLTGDYRLGEMFEEMKDSEAALLEKDPLDIFYNKEQMEFSTHARTGPDWSSLCGNWLTRWERFGDSSYKDKITIGIADIKQAPLQLVSGPDFEFDPASFHLRYIGERASGGIHLQICMGAPEIWIELSELLDDEKWTKMLADYGRFYYLDKQQQQAESNGMTGDRVFSLPYMAGAMGAFGAAYYGDKELGDKTWDILLNAILSNQTCDGFRTSNCYNYGNQRELAEIPWISTNFASQWCLNVIVALEFIRDMLPNKKK